MDSNGFTLIELMVVLLILAILLAIAIPTFLGTSKSANDRGAQSNLNTALVNGNSVYQTNGQSFGIGTTAQYAQFAANLVTSLKTDEPALTFTTSTSSGPSAISLSVSRGGNGLILANRAHSGTCWYAIDNSQAISTINSASTTAPYKGTATATNTAGKAAATKIVIPNTAGTWYAEVMGDTTASDCSASVPKITGVDSKYQIAKSTFPN